MIALILPVAAMLPLTAPLDQSAAMRLGLSAAAASDLAQLGTAQAATRTAKKRVVGKAVPAKAPTKRVCTTRKIKGKLVKSCKLVKVVPVRLAPMPLPAPAAPPPVPVMSYAPVPPPPLPAPTIAPPQSMQVPAIAYYWIDQADSYASALGNSPPDFTFRYDGTDSWAWQSRSGEVLIVEPGQGGVVQYYFGPRDTAPYLVRDSYFAYGFDGRELVQIYDNSGRIYTGQLGQRQRYDSQDLQDRGRALYAASLRQRRWDGGAAIAWGSQYSSFGYNDGWNYGWSGFWRERSDWDRFERDRYRDRPPRRLDEEHRRRRDSRHDYDDWRRSGSYGAPPATGNPVVTPAPAGGAAGPGTGPRPPRGGAQGGAPPPGPQQGSAPAPAPAPLPPVAPSPPPPPQAAPVPPPAPTTEPPRRRPPREVSEDAPVEDRTLPAGDPQPQPAPPVRAPRQWTAPPAPPPPPPPPPPPAPAQYEAPEAAPAPPPPAPVQYEAPPPPPPAPVQYEAPQPAPAPPPPPPAPSPPPSPPPRPAPAPAPAPDPEPAPTPRDQGGSGESERP